MTKVGNTRHLSRLNAPRSWLIKRKLVHGVYTVKPTPGPHSIENSIPLGILLRDYLKYAKTMREARKILGLGKVYVDGVVRKNYKFPVGLFDVIYLKDQEEYYRVVLDSKGRLSLLEIDEKESRQKIGFIKKKTLVKGNKIQITTHDGRNWQFDREEGNKFKTKDSLLFEIPSQKIIDHIKREKGVIIYCLGGSHLGELGRLVEIKKYRGPQPNTAIVETLDGNIKYETLEDYVIPIGKDKPLIKLQ